MSTLEIVFLSIAALELLIIVCMIGYNIKKKKSKRVVYEKDGVRYTVDDNVKDQEGNVNVTLTEKDIILAADKVYKVQKNGYIKPGRYNILSSQAHKEKVTLKVNGIARNQKHDSGIIFVEGDVVIAENDSVILR